MSKLEVLHPTDLTKGGQVAFAHALRIAIVGDSRLELLHVTSEDVQTSWDDFPTATALLERWGWLEPGSDAAALAALGVATEEWEVESYNVVRSLLNHLDDNPADLIVFATRGQSNFETWWRGSIAEPVARVSRTMSLFVPNSVEGFVSLETGGLSLNNVLLPVCAKPAPQHALRAARSLIQALGVSDCKLTMCFVGDAEDAPQIDDDDAQLILRSGNVVNELLAAAGEYNADMIVMTTEGHTGILDAFRGSTTEQLVRRATCPVLAVPAVA